MKFWLIENLRPFAVGGFLLVSILGAPNGHGQAPPGPLPQTAAQDGSTAPPPKAPVPDVPRTKVLAGTWRLNQDESDDPMKKLQQARGSGNGGQGGGRRGGGGMGGGWPGGGGMGGRGGMGGGESDSDRQKMNLFLQPANQLTVVQKEPEIDIARR